MHPNQMLEPPQLAPFLTPRSSSPNSNSPQMSMSSCYVPRGKSKMVRQTDAHMVWFMTENLSFSPFILGGNAGTRAAGEILGL